MINKIIILFGFTKSAHDKLRIGLEICRLFYLSIRYFEWPNESNNAEVGVRYQASCL